VDGYVVRVGVMRYILFWRGGIKVTQLHFYVIARCSSQRRTTLTTEHMFGVCSGWKSVDNYDTCASVFVVQFNGFMSLTS